MDSEQDTAVWRYLTERYDMVERLGAGAHGAVWIARPVAARGLGDGQGAEVAIKILKGVANGNRPSADALREWELLAKQDHPHIVKVLGELIRARDSAAIVMELVNGESLHARLIGPKPLPIDAACAIALSVAAALGHAHDNNVIHRDIKPSNVLLTRDGVAKVVDFGIARPFDGHTLVPTGPGGTPPYMAPEQFIGSDHSKATDLYSLAAVLYRMIAGRHPYPDGINDSYVQRRARGRPPERPDGPARIVDVIMRNLRAVPVDRHQNAAAFSFALAAAANEELGAGWLDDTWVKAVLEADVRAVATRRVVVGRSTVPSQSDAPTLPSRCTFRRVGIVGDPSQAWLWSLALSPDGGSLAVAGHNGVRLWDVRNPALAHPYMAPPEGQGDDRAGMERRTRGVAFRPDGELFATSHDDATLRLWRIGAAGYIETVGSRVGCDVPAFNLAFSPDGGVLAAAAGRQEVGLWDVRDPEKVRPLGRSKDGHQARVLAVAFSPDGRMLASSSRDQTVRLWDVTDPTRIRALGTPLTSHDSLVLGLDFAPKGDVLATAGFDRTVQLWDVSLPRAPLALGAPLAGHTDQVWGVAFSPDGRLLASGGHDRTVRLWDVTVLTAVSLRPELVGSHKGWVKDVAFGPDGRTLAVAGYDGEATLWELTR